MSVTRPYRAEIDGLRAVSIVPVVLFHAGIWPFSGGFVGVDVFFVISGYLISNILIADLEVGRLDLLAFYERRARRILPALFTMMAACLPFAWLWLSPYDLHSFAASMAAVVTFSSNILFWLTSGYFDPDSNLRPLLHTWSLAVEEQFYIFYPLLLWWLWRLGRQWVVAVLSAVLVVSLVGGEWASLREPSAAFYLLPTRAWELVVGALAALAPISPTASPRRRWLAEGAAAAGVLLIAYAVFAFDEHTPFPGRYALAPTLGAAAVILWATPATVAGRVLSTRLCAGLGLISYSAYLWHQPLIAFARHRSLVEPPPLAMAALCVVTFGLAFLSWKYVEQPFRNRHTVGRRAVFAVAAVGSTAFAAVGLVGYLQDGFPSRFDPRTQALRDTSLAALEADLQPCWQKFDDRAEIDAACAIGRADTTSFALLGDSHAGALRAELETWASANGVGGLNYSYRTCPPVRDIQFVSTPSNEDVTCWRLRRSFFAALEAGGPIPDTIVVAARWPLLIERERFDNGEGGREGGGDWVYDVGGSSPDEYANTMAATIVSSLEAMLARGKRLVLVYPVPEMGWNVPRQLAKVYRIFGQLAPGSASTARTVYETRNRRTLRALDAVGEHPNLVRVKPADILCVEATGRCLAHVNGEPLYYDDDHLSRTGAAPVAAAVVKAIESFGPPSNAGVQR